MISRGAIQVQYRVPRALEPVSKADLISAFDRWLEGAAPGPIGVEVTVWGQRLSEDGKRRRVRELGDRRHRPGRVEHYADPHLTMCDYDGPRPKLPELWRVWKLARQFGARPLWIKDRRTKRGWHRVVYWDRPFEPMQTIALQLLLGSDREREAFNLKRVLLGGANTPRWNLLFSEKLS